jgi:hypothetical protein
MFWQRSVARVEGERGFTIQNFWLTLGNNTLRALGMFNAIGDTVWANTVPYKPALDEVGGAFFLMGVLAIFCRLFGPKVAGKQRNWLLLAAILSGVVLLLPTILSLSFPIENPSAVRAAGAIPLAAVLVGWGLYVTARAVSQLGGPRWGKWLAALLLAVMLASAACINYQRYFVTYYRSYQLSSWNSTEMAKDMRNFIAKGGDLKHITIRAWPYWVDTRALALLMGDPSWQNTNVVIERVTDLARLRDDPAFQMYLLNVNDKEGLAELQTTFPLGYTTRHVSPIPGKDYILFYVPPRT